MVWILDGALMCFLLVNRLVVLSVMVEEYSSALLRFEYILHCDQHLYILDNVLMCCCCICGAMHSTC